MGSVETSSALRMSLTAKETMMGHKDKYRPPKDARYGHPRFESGVAWTRYLALDEEERRMDLKLPDDIRMMRMDKQALKRAVDELNAQMGFVPTPGMTPEQSQRAFLDAGIRPEENAASCEIKHMRSERTGT
jgi:hypothetical protein